MRLLCSVKACTAWCTLLHARTHVLRAGQYLQVVWQVVAKYEAGRLAWVDFKVPEIATVLGVPHSSRYGRAVKLELSGELCHGDRLALRVLSQPLDCYYGLPDGGRHDRLHALTNQVDYQFPDGRVVLDGGDYAAFAVALACCLMQKSVGSDEIQQRTEVSPEPYRHRWDEFGQFPGVRYPDAMLGTLQPNLEGMPSFEVWSSLALFVCQCCHDGTSLILCVRDGKGEKSGFVLWVELYGGRGHDEACWAFSLDETRLHTLGGLFHGLIANAPFRKQRAHEVGGEFTAHACRLVDDQEAMLYGFLGVGQGAFAHGRESVIGALRYEGEHPLHHMALAAGRWTFEGDADRPSQQPRRHSKVQELNYAYFPSAARLS